jgi:hypothetical protein
MECPNCYSSNLSTLETRATGSTQRRRRLCKDCSYRFTTYEMLQHEYDKCRGAIKLIRDVHELISPKPKTPLQTKVSRSMACPCNTCQYASGFKCSHGYPEYGTPQAEGCLMYQQHTPTLNYEQPQSQVV